MKLKQIHYLKRLLPLVVILFLSGMLHAQSLQVKGRVTDALSKKPIEGVSISVKNAKTITSTDADGQFSISAVRNSQLLISSVGFQTKQVTVSGENLMISLEAAVQQLDEVVITAL
eukprot:Opistho-1_new@105363